ncbi:MAG TPA: DM13 domain-containing protein [Xanthobacteraceae bacterium]|nr:DM13 domain-containing protein [Xanthobacteraceae bacterium]
MFSRFWGKVRAFFFGGVLGTIFGIALGFFFFPYVFPPPPAAEQLTQADLAPPPGAGEPAQDASAPAAIAVPLATGSFIHANTSDPVHWGKGKVSVYRRAVFLEPDFEVGPGPAYHVYLVPKPSIRSSSDMKGVMYVDLGRLHSFKGSQRYQIPDGVNLKDYPSVIIWCERFGVLISPADLKVVPASN